MSRFLNYWQSNGLSNTAAIIISSKMSDEPSDNNTNVYYDFMSKGVLSAYYSTKNPAFFRFLLELMAVYIITYKVTTTLPDGSKISITDNPKKLDALWDDFNKILNPTISGNSKVFNVSQNEKYKITKRNITMTILDILNGKRYPVNPRPVRQRNILDS